MLKVPKVHPDSIFYSPESSVILMTKSKGFQSPIHKQQQMVIPTATYKHIHSREPEENIYQDCYSQLFSNNLSASLQKSIPDTHLMNPKPYIFMKKDKKLKQLKGILTNFKKSPCFTANRDQSTMVLQLHSDVVYALEVTHDQRFLLSGSGDKTVIQWDLINNQYIRSFIGQPSNSKTQTDKKTGHTDAIYDLKITADDRYFLTGSGDRTIRIWEMSSGDVLGVLKGQHKAPVFSLILIEGTKRVISGSGDKSIVIWDYEAQKALVKLKGHTDIVRPMTITQDMRKLISGGYDTNLIVWDLDELNLNTHQDFRKAYLNKESMKNKARPLEEELTILTQSNKDVKPQVQTMILTRSIKVKAHGLGVKALVITPDSKYVISSSLDFTIKIWNIEKIEKGEFQTIEGSNVTAYSLAISNKHSYIFSGGWDRIIRVWDLHTRKFIKTLEGHTDALRSFVLSGDMLITGAADKSIRIWNFNDKHEKVLLEGQRTPVRALAITGDKRYLFSAGDGKTIKMWDFATCEECTELKGHTAVVRVMEVTFDSSKLVSGSVDKTIRVWDIASRTHLFSLNGHTEAINALVITNDGSKIVSGGNDKTIMVWSLKEKKELFKLEGHTNTLRAVVVTPDNSQIISGSWDKSIRIWNMQTFKQIAQLLGHTDAVLVLAISPSGKFLASGSFDKTIKIWDLENREEWTTLIGHTGTIRSLVISSDSTKVFSGGFDKTIRVWDIESGCQIGIFEGHTATIYSILLTPDSTTLISSSWDQTIRIWRLEYKNQIESLKGHTDAVRSVAISPDSSKIVCGSADNSIRVWDTNTKTQTAILWGHTSTVYALLITSDSARIVSGSGDKSIKVWDIESKQSIKHLQRHTDAIWTLAFTPDLTKLISAGADKTIRVWNYESEKYLGEMIGHTGTIYSLAITKDSRNVISGGRDPLIYFWDLETKQKIKTLESNTGTVYALAIAFDSKLITGNWDKTIRVWDLTKGEQTVMWEGKDVVRSLVMTADGTKIISGSADCCIRVWDLESKKVIGEIMKGHTGAVRSLTMTPDSKKVISGSYDNSMRIWDLDKRTVLGHMEVQGSTYSVLMTPDKTKILSTSYEKDINYWDIETHQKSTLKGHDNVIRSVIFSPDSKRIISGSADKTIIIWDIEKKEMIGKPLQGHEDIVYCLVISSNALNLISGSYDRTIKVWDLITMKNITTFNKHGGAVNALLLLADQDTLISASSDKTIRVWSLERQEQINILEGHKDYVKTLAITPNEHYLLSGGGDKTIRLWSVRELNMTNMKKEKRVTINPDTQPTAVAILEGHATTVRTIVVTPDSKKIISGSYNNTIRIWDIDARVIIFKIESIISLQSNPFIESDNGRVLALLGHIVFDFKNETPLFAVSDFENLHSVLYCEPKKSLICINKSDELLEKSFQTATSFGGGFALMNKIFDEENPNREGDVRKMPILSPFYYNFLHIVALFDNQLPFRIPDLETIKVPIQYFLQLDFLNQTCLDIAIEQNLKSLLKILMQIMVASIKDPATSFYQKMRIFAYEFNPIDPKSFYYPIFTLFSNVLAIFDRDTTIISQMLDLSYIEIDPACFFNNLSADELSEPLYLIINKVSDLKSESALKSALTSKDKWGILRSPGLSFGQSEKKQAYVKCKIFLLKGFTEINLDSRKMLKKIMSFPPSNPLFSNKVFQLFIRFKWETYAKRYLLQEFITFLMIFMVFVTNNIYILPARNESLGDQFGSSKFDTLSLIFEIILIAYFTYYTIKEILQIKRSGIVAYFSSPWNWFDLILVPLVIGNASLDIYQITLLNSQIENEKIVASITFLIFWLRVLSYSRAFEGTGFMLRLVIQVILDMRYFLMMIILFNLAFGSAAFMLQKGFAIGPWFCFTAFYRLMLGDFNMYDSDIVNAENGIIIWIIMILFTLLLSVIMLNLLISIIGETFSKVRAAESSMKYYELYSIINEIDDSLGASTVKKMREEKKIGNYLVCLFNQESQSEEEVGQNEMAEKTKKIEKDVLKMAEEMQSLNREMKEFRKHIYDDIAEIKAMLVNEREKEKKK